MKKSIFAIFLCILLTGCANANNQQEAPAVLPLAEETQAESAVSVIQPLPDTTMETLADSTVHISFGENDFFRDESGNFYLHMQVYSYDKFDMVDISGLKAGDTILLSGDEIPVNSVERNEQGTVLVNGGLDEGGFDLATDDGGIYFVHGYSDMKSWNLVGEAEYPVWDDFVFTDSADLEQSEIAYSAAELLDSFPLTAYGYQPQNITVRIENGQVVAMERIYTP